MTEPQFRGAVIVSVCVVGVLAYANAFTNGFVWDDVSSVLLHKHVQDPSQFLQLFREDQHAFGRGHGDFYRPLVAASFMLDYALSRSTIAREPATLGVPQPSPFLFHLTNLSWHLAAALLFLALLIQLRAPRPVCAIVPLLYVAHPLHTEAVTYISGRADPMAAALMFLAVWLSLSGTTPLRRSFGIVSSWLCFMAALLCKESAAIYPVLLVLMMVAIRRLGSPAQKNRPLRYDIVSGIGAAIIVTVYGALRMGPLDFTKGIPAAPPPPLGQRLLETGQAFTSYMRLIFVPTHLHMERALIGVPTWVAVMGYLLVAACLGGVVVSFRYKQPRIAFGLIWYLVTWLPISGLFPLNAPMAEHWLYVPLAGFLWAFAETLWLLVTRWPVTRYAVYPAVFGMLALFIGLTVHRNRDWRNNETLYLATLAENPASNRVQYNLAVTYGDLLHDLPAARRHYREAIALLAENHSHGLVGGDGLLTQEKREAQLSLGQIALKLGHYDEAANQFGRLLKHPLSDATRPIMAMAALGMGQCYLAARDIPHAAKSFNAAVKMEPQLKAKVTRLMANSLLPGVG